MRQLSTLMGATQIAQFRANGFVFVDGITSDLELRWLDGVCHRIISDRVSEAHPVLVSQGSNILHNPLFWAKLSEWEEHMLRDALFVKNAREIAARLLCSDVHEISTSIAIFYKPALVGGETPWHQDEAYLDPSYMYRNVKIWVPLTDASIDNGCLYYIPGSHYRGVHTHIRDTLDPTGLTLRVQRVNLKNAVAVPVKAGAAIVHHCRTLHYAGPNRTPVGRGAFTVTCSLSPVKRERKVRRPWLISPFTPFPSSNVFRDHLSGKGSME